MVHKILSSQERARGENMVRESEETTDMNMASTLSGAVNKANLLRSFSNPMRHSAIVPNNDAWSVTASDVSSTDCVSSLSDDDEDSVASSLSDASTEFRDKSARENYLELNRSFSMASSDPPHLVKSDSLSTPESRCIRPPRHPQLHSMPNIKNTQGRTFLSKKIASFHDADKPQISSREDRNALLGERRRRYFRKNKTNSSATLSFPIVGYMNESHQRKVEHTLSSSGGIFRLDSKNAKHLRTSSCASDQYGKVGSNSSTIYQRTGIARSESGIPVRNRHDRPKVWDSAQSGDRVNVIIHPLLRSFSAPPPLDSRSEIPDYRCDIKRIRDNADSSDFGFSMEGSTSPNGHNREIEVMEYPSGDDDSVEFRHEIYKRRKQSPVIREMKGFCSTISSPLRRLRKYDLKFERSNGCLT